MANSGGKITSPVSFADVNSVLGTRHTSLGLLCTDNNINKWAKYKPVRYNKIGMLTDNERRSVVYGLYNKPQEYTDIYLARLARDCAFNPLSNYWVYQTPRGGNFNEPYRLTDFVKNPNDSGSTKGYNANAEVPFASDLGNAMSFYSGGEYNINKAVTEKIYFVAYEIAMRDISILDILNISVYSDYCLVVDVYETDPLTATSNVPIPTLTYSGNVLTRSKTYSEVTLPTNILSVKTYYVLIGLMRVQNGNRVSGSARLAPRTRDQELRGRLSYYFKLNIQNYLTMKFEVLQVTCTSNSGWFTNNAGVYETSQYINGALIVHLRVTRTTRKYYFAKGTTTIPSDGGLMQIYITPYRWSGNYEATPLNSNREFVQYAEIPASTSTSEQWVDLYAMFEFPNSKGTGVETILNDGYNSFALRATVYGNEQRDCGSFSTHRIVG